MPIQCDGDFVRPTQSEFGAISYDVMKTVYDIHNDFGRLFEEAVYKRELARRLSGVELEVPIVVSHDGFSKTFRLDVLIHRRGLFEFKAVDTISPKHRGQVYNYLLLSDLPHGKIVNVRSERVIEEFVNCRFRLQHLRSPSIDVERFKFNVSGASFFHEHLLGLIHDWGCGLDLSLYEEAIAHFLGGDDRILLPMSVYGLHGHIHDQKARQIAPGVSFKITAFSDRLAAFEAHAQRLIRHTSLSAIHWANITNQAVRFVTIQ